ncbi:hypothetical protein Scep_010388 [Stephania cephalantha]|uniref:Uncharacterized protein n=1 Tax=Stephania cephalantha TaxID=152367 RepID=A0AAP0PE24_9MAGN
MGIARSHVTEQMGIARSHVIEQNQFPRSDVAKPCNLNLSSHLQPKKWVLFGLV